MHQGDQQTKSIPTAGDLLVRRRVLAQLGEGVCSVETCLDLEFMAETRNESSHRPGHPQPLVEFSCHGDVPKCEARIPPGEGGRRSFIIPS